MGTSVSNKTQKSVYRETVKSVNKSVTNVENSSKSDASLVQQAKISCKACSLKNGCKIELNQKGQAAATAILNADNDLAKEMSNDLGTKLKQAVDSEIKQANKGFNFGNTNVSNLKQQSETIINKQTENIMKSSS